jgi:hypothetical protein
MERRHQVFVSSTYQDLIEERRAVIQALLELDCIPAGMEMFPAANEDQWSLIEEVIAQSDYYIVIVGGRYGSTTAEGVSYTEKEYDYAVEAGLPVLGFVHADPESIPARMSEIDAEAREKLDQFRSKVMSRMVKRYATADELASVVSRGLIRAIKHDPRPGWVRGDYAMTDATRAEIAELRAALAEAEQKRTVAESALDEPALDTRFAHGDQTVELTFEIRYGRSYETSTQTVELDFTWDEVIEIVGPLMLDEAPEPHLRKALTAAVPNYLRGIKDGGWGDVNFRGIEIEDESWGHVLVQLRALGVIRAGIKKRTVSDRAVYWALTRAGDDYLVKLKATPNADA